MVKSKYRRAKDHAAIVGAAIHQQPFLVQHDAREGWADMKGAPAQFVRVLGVKLPDGMTYDAHLEWLDSRRRFLRVWVRGILVHDEVTEYAS